MLSVVMKGLRSYKLETFGINARYFSRYAMDWLLEKKQKQKCLYFGWLGMKNLGDDALHSSISTMLLPHANLYPSYEVDRIFLPDPLKKKLFSTFILGGGTFINREPELIDHLFSRATGIPNWVVYGTGVANPLFWKGSNKWRDSAEKWKEFLNRCSHIGVRGPTSLEILSEWGISNVEVVGDPVLYFASESAPIKVFSKRIGINIGVTGNNLWGGSDTRVFDTILTLCRYLIKERWKVSFFSVWPPDTQYLQELIKHLSGGKISLFDGSQASTEEVAEYFENIDLFVGEKLHSCIFSAVNYTPNIMLEYRPKCLDFMRSMGLEEFNIRTDCLHIDEIVSKIKKLSENIDFYEKHLYMKTHFYKRKLIQFSQKVSGIT